MKKALSSVEIDAIIDILNKFQTSPSALNAPTFSFKDLFKILSNAEQRLVSDLCNLSPELAKLEARALDKLVVTVADDYSKRFVRVHLTVYKSFNKMNAALIQQTSQRLSITSGYRSPAYQVLIFLRELYNADFNIARAERVAKLPSESEHAHYPSHAIDVAIEQSQIGKKEISTNFEETDAYRWMVTHAGKYGFSLSYPENNQKNTIFEPWHWLYAVSD